MPLDLHDRFVLTIGLAFVVGGGCTPTAGNNGTGGDSSDTGSPRSTYLSRLNPT